MVIPVLPLVILAVAIVYLVFMFKKGWYWQTLMGIAVAGGFVSGILGLRRLTDQEGNEVVGAVLLLGGILVIVTSAIVIRKMRVGSSSK